MRSFSAALCLLPVFAFASSMGITGFSGRDGATCSTCHIGVGTAPTVTLSGPATLNGGATGTYTLNLSGGPGAMAGFNAALGGANSGQAVLGAGADMKLSGGELIHAKTAAFAGGSASFSFTVKAPLTAGPFTIYAAGLSANGAGSNKDDNSGAATLVVTVNAATMTAPDAGSVTVAPKADAGVTTGGTTGGTTGSTTTIKTNNNKQVAETDTRRGIAEGEFGCSSTSSVPMVLMSVAVLMVLFTRRRAAVKTRN